MDITELAAKIDDLCEFIEEESVGAETAISVENKLLRDALNEQIAIQMKWGIVLSRIIRLHEEAKLYTQKAFSEAFYDLIVNNNRSFTTTEAKIVAEMDNNYISFKLLENRALQTRKEVEEIVKTVETRKYTLNNLTRLVIDDKIDFII